MIHKVKVPEEQRSPEGQRVLKAESPKRQSALKGIVPKREKFTESPTIIKGLNSDMRGRGLRTRRRRTLNLTPRSAWLHRQLKIVSHLFIIKLFAMS